MEMLIRRFWWSKGDNDRGIAWVAWDKVVKNRQLGGLQFKKLKQFNLAMLAKQGWRLINNPNSLCSRVIKAKYFPNDSFMNAKLGHGPSFAWRGIIEGRKIIERGSRWKIGDGRSIRIKDRWITVNKGALPITIIDDGNNNVVRDLMDISGTIWDRDKVQEVFWPVDVVSILNIQIPRVPMEDKLIWNGNVNGKYSVKTGYELACFMETNEGEGMSSSNSAFYTKLWATKIPKKNLHFIWRLLQKSIPTANNLRRRGIQVDRVCKRCLVKDEDESHCFIKCDHSKKIWDLLFPGNCFLTNRCDFNVWLEDQISSGSDSSRVTVFITLYSIWLARNKSIFEGQILGPRLIAADILRRIEELQSVLSGPVVSVPSSTTVPQTSGLLSASISRGSAARVTWKKPPEGFIKFNFDAGFMKDNNTGVGGIVGRDCTGTVLVAGCFQLNFCVDAKHAEALAILKAMYTAVMLGFRSVLFEGDCKLLLDEIRGRRGGEVAHDITEVEDVINSFFLSSSALDQWEYNFTKREGNTLAHFLATRRRSLDTNFFYFTPIPDWLVVLANCDVSATVFPP